MKTDKNKVKGHERDSSVSIKNKSYTARRGSSVAWHGTGKEVTKTIDFSHFKKILIKCEKELFELYYRKKEFLQWLVSSLEDSTSVHCIAFL